MMKRLFFTMMLAGMAGGAMAQESDGTNFEAVPTSKYSVATNSFWSNWFLQVGGTYNVFYDNAEQGMNSENPFKGFRSTPGLTISLGKWFTPGIGLRTKLDGFWGKSITAPGEKNKNIKYWMLNEQVLFNMSNLFCGYKESRVWNLSLYAGPGIARNMTMNTSSMMFSAGVLNTWRLNKVMNIFLDVQLAHGAKANIADFSGMYRNSGKGSFLKNHDNIVSAELGLSFNLGKNRFKAVPDVDALLAQHKAQMDDMNARLRNAEDENNKLKDELANAPKETAAVSTTSYSGAGYSVFFNLNSAKLVSHKDVLNLRSIADFAKANSNAKVICDGYADSETGSASYNQRLSERRAKAVADKLIELGVPSSQITTNGLGGAKDVSPYKYNRRVIISVK